MTNIAPGALAPLRLPLFRKIWLASLLSNLGLMIQGVGAAWAMTTLTDRADMVALVQTALLLPIMLFAMPAGALADMFDRRLVGLAAATLSLFAGTLMTVIVFAGWLSPVTILCMTFLVGAGMALFGPAWQASVGEQVPPPLLPSAIALTSISYNVARSFGPAIGGLIVAAAGAGAAFMMNALLYLPLIIVLYSWKRLRAEPRLPPERIDRAIISGLRYVANAPPIRTVVIRSVLTGLAGASVPALMPLIARHILHGNATLYGIMLGAFGVGAVVGASQLSTFRQRFSTETLVRWCTLLCGLAILVISFSTSTALTLLFLGITGAAWMMVQTCFNVAIQLAAPRWVTGRALAAYHASITGGMAIGSWVWGNVAGDFGTIPALAISGMIFCLLPAVGLLLRIPDMSKEDGEREAMMEPNVALQLTGRSGPIILEIDYVVPAADARRFYSVMLKLQQIRQRNGGYGWSISRNLSADDRWTERYHCPTWYDYLRMRDRMTIVEATVMEEAMNFMPPGTSLEIRRYLERPFGSVRWKDDTPDPLLPMTPGH